MVEIPLTVIGTVGPWTPEGEIVLVRLEDERFRHTGIIAGMSGSPVYVDGRLARGAGLRLVVFEGAHRWSDAVFQDGEPGRRWLSTAAAAGRADRSLAEMMEAGARDQSR